MDAPQTSKVLPPPKRKKWSIWTLLIVLLISLLIGWATRHSTRYPVVRIPCEPLTFKPLTKSQHRFIGMIDEDRLEAIVISNRSNSGTSDLGQRRFEILIYSLITGLEKLRVTPKMPGSFRNVRRVGSKLIAINEITVEKAPVAVCVDIGTGNVDWQLPRLPIESGFDLVNLSPCGRYLTHTGEQKCETIRLVDTQTGATIKELQKRKTVSGTRVLWSADDRYVVLVEHEESSLDQVSGFDLIVRAFHTDTGLPISGNSSAIINADRNPPEYVRSGINWPTFTTITVPTKKQESRHHGGTTNSYMPSHYATEFACVRIDEQAGVTVEKSDYFLIPADRVSRSKNRVARKSRYGWIDIRAENPWIKQLESIDKLLATFRIVSSMAKFNRNQPAREHFCGRTARIYGSSISTDACVFLRRNIQ